MTSRRRLGGVSLAVWAAAAALVMLLSAQNASSADRYRQQCARLNKQLIHYDGVAKMARKRGDVPWFEATRNQIKSLEAREKKLCPEQFAAGRARRARREMAQMMRVAGQVALRYFTFGAL